MSGSTEFWMESRAQEGDAQRSASCLAERPSSEVTAASRRNWRRWFAGTGALILRAPRNATEARRPPRRGRGGASVRAGAPRAGLLSRLSRKGKRCLSGPQSVHASRGALFKPRDHADCSIPGVLFPGSCRPDCTLSHHTVQASAASAALREERSPQGERGRNT